jgi:DNA-binding transcriptional LysR family regulator
VGQPRHNRSTTIRLGCLPEQPLQRLLAFLGALYQRDPGLVVDLEHLHAGGQLRRLREGDLDVALVHGAYEDPYEAESVFPGEPLTAFLATGHRLSAKRTVTTDDLAPEPLLLPPQRTDPVLHDWLLSVARSNGYSLDGVREIGAGHVRDVLVAVAEGRGLTLNSPSVMRTVGEIDTVVIGRRVDPVRRLPDTVAVWRADRRTELGALPGVIRAVARELRAA